MKKSTISKILLASLSILIMNSCNKSSEIPIPTGCHDSTCTTHSGPSFDLAYVITPVPSDIRSITFNDENGNPKTVYDMSDFPDGIIEVKVSANSFKAWIGVTVDNTTGHPFGLHLEIRVNGQTKQTKDFTIPTLGSNTTLDAEYDVQFD